jgi:hypothetical protein
MIGIVLAFPQMVMHYKGVVVDPGTVEIKVPELPGFGLPPLGAPPAGGAPAPPSGGRSISATELRGSGRTSATSSACRQ